MPTQKTFKQRVRTRMAKTGEAYTAARHQLLDKAGAADQPGSPGDGAPAFSTTDEAIRRATGRPHHEWFAILDGWGATQRTHTQIARWLHEDQAVGSWWSQSITVDYERARGMRAQHEMTSGFSVSVTRTLGQDADTLLRAFTDAKERTAWLPDAPLAPRPTRAKLTAQFDWADPASRVVVTVTPKGVARATITVSHERLPDARVAESLKRSWRTWLDTLKSRVKSE